MVPIRVLCLSLVIFAADNVLASYGTPKKNDAGDNSVIPKLEKALESIGSNVKVVEITSHSTSTLMPVAGTKYFVKYKGLDNGSDVANMCQASWIEWSEQNFNGRPESVENNCRANYAVGGLKPVDKSEDDLVQDLGELAVRMFDTIDADTDKTFLVQVLNAQKQLVNGIMYHLTLKIKTTECSEESKEDNGCSDREIGPRKICTVKIYRSFIDSDLVGAKVVDSVCTADSPIADQVSVEAHSDYIREIAAFAADHVNTMTNSIYVKAISKILQAKIQMVSGMKIFLKLELGDTPCLKNHVEDQCEVRDDSKDNIVCDVVVWDQKWKKSRTIVSSSCSNSRSKRSVPGGQTEIEPDDPRVESLRGFIASELTARANGQYSKTVVKVMNATVQVVSGTLIRATVEVADTNCLKTENNGDKECSASSQGRQICQVTIWQQPWLNKKEIKESECHSIPTINDGDSVKTQVDCLYNCDPKLT